MMENKVFICQDSPIVGMQQSAVISAPDPESAVRCFCSETRTQGKIKVHIVDMSQTRVLLAVQESMSSMFLR